MTPKFSIMIPVFNRKVMIKECIDSLLQQSFEDFELIIISNASTDGTDDIIRSFEDSRVKLITTSTKGIANARNLGVENASGDLLVFTDSDCQFPADWLKKYIDVFDADEQLEAASSGELDISGTKWSKIHEYMDSMHLKSHIEGKYLNHIDTKNFVVRKEKMEGYIFDPKVVSSSDFDLYCTFQKEGIQILYIDNIVFHRSRETLFKMMKSKYDQGFSFPRIYIKNPHCRHLAEFDSIKIGKTILIIPYLIKLLLLCKMDIFIFELLSAIAWRVGAVAGLVSFGLVSIGLDRD